LASPRVPSAGNRPAERQAVARGNDSPRPDAIPSERDQVAAPRKHEATVDQRDLVDYPGNINAGCCSPWEWADSAGRALETGIRQTWRLARPVRCPGGRTAIRPGSASPPEAPTTSAGRRSFGGRRLGLCRDSANCAPDAPWARLGSSDASPSLQGPCLFTPRGEPPWDPGGSRCRINPAQGAPHAPMAIGAGGRDDPAGDPAGGTSSGERTSPRYPNDRASTVARAA
jgi:hypothetical protein